MAFPDSTWTQAGKLTHESSSPKQVKLCWDIYRDVICLRVEENTLKLKSDDFSFGDATWNFFASFDVIKSHIQFGIVRTHSSDEALYCNCDISFVTARNPLECIKNTKCNFIFQGAQSHSAVTVFLTSHEMDAFLEYGEIECLISLKNIEEACSQTEEIYFNQSSSTETLTQIPENENKDIPIGSIDCKVCHDFNNLLLSGEGSDVTLRVQDQEFKAHRSVITARSSVFAAMFRHNMKEKATGVVNVEDCEPSYFPVLLEFLYCGSTKKLSIENMFSLYTSADKYDVQDLKIKCIEFIQNNLSVETFCDTVRLSLQHSETSLLKLTTDFFSRNLKKIILTVKWQTFIAENPIQSNELFVKALVSNVQEDPRSTVITANIVNSESAISADIVNSESAISTNIIKSESAISEDIVNSESAISDNIIKSESAISSDIVRSESATSADIVNSESARSANVYRGRRPFPRYRGNGRSRGRIGNREKVEKAAECSPQYLGKFKPISPRYDKCYNSGGSYVEN